MKIIAAILLTALIARAQMPPAALDASLLNFWPAQESVSVKTQDKVIHWFLPYHLCASESVIVCESGPTPNGPWVEIFRVPCPANAWDGGVFIDINTVGDTQRYFRFGAIYNQ